MTTVLRFLFVIPIGFVLACFAAAFAMLWPFLELPDGALSDPFLVFELLVFFTAQAAQVGSAALLPWGLFMALSEITGLRSILLHMGAGIAGGFAALRLSPGGAPTELSLQTAFVVAGLSFALVYWLVAGRGAGRWRRRRTAPTPAAPLPPVTS